MYNPEESMKRESDLRADQELLRETIAREGENHPWTQRVRLATDVLQSISKKENDLDNCFDPIERKKIENTIEELIQINKEILQEMEEHCNSSLLDKLSNLRKKLISLLKD